MESNKTEDLSVIDQNTGDKVAEMSYNETVFDQKSSEDIDTIIGKIDNGGDTDVLFLQLGELVYKERKTHEDAQKPLTQVEPPLPKPRKPAVEMKTLPMKPKTPKLPL